MADATSAVQPDMLAQFIPKVDPWIVLLVAFIFLFLLFFLIVGALFAYAVKRNWIILKYPYRILMLKPSGNSVAPFVDAGAMIKDEKNRMKMHLKTAGFNIKIPDREFFYNGNWLFGYSASFNEFIPMKMNLIGFRGAPDLRRLKEISTIPNEVDRQKAMNAYTEELRMMNVQFKPHVDSGIMNSLVTEGSAINRELPKKLDWLPYVALGLSALLIIVVFMLWTAGAMKDFEAQTARAHADEVMANSMSHMADVMNSTTQVNNKLSDILNATTRTTYAVPK